jgi:hypothetical protein
MISRLIASYSSAGAASPMSRLLIRHASVNATAPSKRPIDALPAASNVGSPVIVESVIATYAKAIPITAPASCNRTTATSGFLDSRMYSINDPRCSRPPAGAR